MPAETVVDPDVVGSAAGLPCNAAPVSVNGTPYYKCSGIWYTAGLTSTGIAYMKVPPPPGQ